MKDYIEERAVEIAYYIIEHKVTNRKYKVYNFVENCRNVNYNIKYEVLSHKTIVKIKKRNIIKI